MKSIIAAIMNLFTLRKPEPTKRLTNVIPMFPSPQPNRPRNARTGIVKWFDSRRGFGVILQDNGPDIFVHYKSIIGSGFRTLRKGWEVSFVLTQSAKGPLAQQVVVLSHETAKAA